MPNPTPKKKLPLDLGSLARAYTERAIQTLAGVLENSTEESNRIRAADILLDRGWGRPKQDNTTTLQGEVRVVLRKMLTDEEEDQ